jgi:hypothetical protein
MSRKFAFSKIKEVYKLHQEIPRIFLPGIKQILRKRYHRKRLLEYFKIAKVLGLKVESINLSSFLLSLNLSKKQAAKSFEPIIGALSSLETSR